MPQVSERPGLKILFAAPEAAPLVKTGGLGDVAGSLPAALGELGHQVDLVIPFYSAVDKDRYNISKILDELPVEAGGRTLTAQVYAGLLGHNRVYLIKCDALFGRSGVYGYEDRDFTDNALRFIFFCRAVAAMAGALGIEADIVHAHDWQTALLPVYLRAAGPGSGPLSRAASVFTIHNLAYQGLFPRRDFDLTGLDRGFFAMEGLEYWGKMNLLKGGVVFADAVTTVSPQYAKEILTPQFGLGLDGVLKSRGGAFSGILNGADYNVWSPETDQFIAANYSAADLGGKAACKKALMKEMGLDPLGDKTSVLGFVGRLTGQKGVDLILEVAPRLLMDDIRICFLGTGEKGLEQGLGRLAKGNPGRVGVRLEYSEALAHRIQAGSDILLMPSRFEPCGLNQIYALRYGTPPVVASTGGLIDTVEPFDPLTGRGAGFSFSPADPQAFRGAVSEALWARARPGLWERLVQNCMALDYSWAASARRYSRLYQRLVLTKR